MNAESGSTAGERKTFLRAPGLLIMLGVVAIGLLAGAIPFRVLAKNVRQGIIADLAETEREASTPETRLDAWLVFGVPQIHNRLRLLAFSPSMPFLISHAVRQPDGRLEVWGVDFLEPESIRVEREGLLVSIHVPQPSSLGIGRLEGDNAERVPIYDSEADVPDPAARLKDLMEWFLGRMQAAVSRDIEGVQLEIVVDLPAQVRSEGQPAE
jgi:hypothetical protein